VYKKVLFIGKLQNFEKENAPGTDVLMEIYEDIPDILTHVVNLKRNWLRVQKRR